MTQKKENLNKIIDHMLSGIYIYDIDNEKNVYINKACSTITGWSLEELNSFKGSFIELFHEEDRVAVLGAMQKVSESDADADLEFPLEYRFKTKDGGWVWCYSVNSAFERDKSGNVVKLVGSFIDITKQREVEHKLMESEDRFRGAFDTSPIGVALVSLEGKWIQVNQSVSDLFGYTQDELLKKTFQDITHPDDLEKDLGLVKQVLDGKIKTYRMEKRYIHKNGTIIWALLNVSLITGPHEKPLYFLSQIIDISRLKKVEKDIKKQVEELESVNKFMIGRELRMSELKEENDALRLELGKEQKYSKNKED